MKNKQDNREIKYQHKYYMEHLGKNRKRNNYSGNKSIFARVLEQKDGSLIFFPGFGMTFDEFEKIEKDRNKTKMLKLKESDVCKLWQDCDNESKFKIILFNLMGREKSIYYQGWRDEQMKIKYKGNIPNPLLKLLV